MNKFLIAAVSGLLASMAAPAVSAQAAQPIELRGDVQVEKLVVENGKEKRVLVKPEVVVPGDRLIFTTAYRNVGAEAAKNVVVTNPIPPGVALAPLGADQLEVSIDGGKTWGRLAALSVNGTAGPRPAQAGDVTHVRWILPVLAPGASGTLSYNALVR